jgi:hypothetical protein
MPAASGLKPVMSAFDFYGFAVRQRIGNLSSCGYHQPVERWLRNIHLFSAFALVEALQVLEPHGFKFVDRKNHLLRLRHSYPCRSERGKGWLETNPPAASSSRHYSISLSLCWISAFSASMRLSSASKSCFCASLLSGSGS